MKRIIGCAAAAFCVLAAQGVQAAAEPAAAQYFIGNWTCVTSSAATATSPARVIRTPWAFTPMFGDAGWIRVIYGDPAKPDGTAIIGYVSDLKKFVYRDFHADGSYADISADP